MANAFRPRGSGTSYEILGIRGFEAALEKVSDAVRKRVGEANHATAWAIQAAARRNLESHRDKGDLIANIAVQGKGMNWRVGILEASIPSRGGDNSAHLNPWVYGLFLEFGFKTFEGIRFMGRAVESEEAGHHVRVQEAGLKIGQDAAKAA